MALVWGAVYSNGEVMYQFGPYGENSTEKIDRRRLKSIRLFDETTGRLILEQVYSPGQKVLFRRRVVHRPSGESETGYILGWISGDGQHFSLVREASPAKYQVLNFCEFCESDPWIYSVKPVPADLVEVGSVES